MASVGGRDLCPELSVGIAGGGQGHERGAVASSLSDCGGLIPHEKGRTRACAPGALLCFQPIGVESLFQPHWLFTGGCCIAALRSWLLLRPQPRGRTSPLSGGGGGLCLDNTLEMISVWD